MGRSIIASPGTRLLVEDDWEQMMGEEALFMRMSSGHAPDDDRFVFALQRVQIHLNKWVR